MSTLGRVPVGGGKGGRRRSLVPLDHLRAHVARRSGVHTRPVGGGVGAWIRRGEERTVPSMRTNGSPTLVCQVCGDCKQHKTLHEFFWVHYVTQNVVVCG